MSYSHVENDWFVFVTCFVFALLGLKRVASLDKYIV